MELDRAGFDYPVHGSADEGEPVRVDIEADGLCLTWL